MKSKLPAELTRRLQKLALEINKPIEILEHEAAEYLSELKTIHQEFPEFLTLMTGKAILDKAYSKYIDVDPIQIRSLTKLAYQYPIAFVMTHKTYIDMLVLGWVLANHALPIPYTFAGKNMDFFGLGPWSRRNGVIFIRRNIKDNIVYKTTLRYYIASLLDKRGSFMWAIEGTRSRTGKLVWPQMGILKYIQEADQHQQVKYVPVSIVYDLIPDVKEMTLEGLGKKKKPESFSWMLQYLKRMMGNLGNISVRFGEPYDTKQVQTIPIPDESPHKKTISGMAFELVNRINEAMPVTTTSLICTSILGTFSLTKQQLLQSVAFLMGIIENQQKDALVDRSKNLSEAVQNSLNLLVENKLLKIVGTGPNARYSIVTDNYMQLVYYSNMGSHHLYLRAFTELAIAKIANIKENREYHFWVYIMQLRDLFKFEFFYSAKPIFSSQIERILADMRFEWKTYFFDPETDLNRFLQKQNLLTFPVLLYNYVEAYKVAALGLIQWKSNEPYDKQKALSFCKSFAEELHWKGKINRIESVSTPYLLNALRYLENKKWVPSKGENHQPELKNLVAQLDEILDFSRDFNNLKKSLVPIPNSLKFVVPGSKTDTLVHEILDGEKGPHIGAFFDLDRTLINGFSAKEFFKKRILSGKMSPREVLAQFAGILTYAANDKNFAQLAALSAKGVKGLSETDFIEVGEEVYRKYLAQDIIPESRALVEAHLQMGHTVCIVSAATPYQVNPIARDLGIEIVRCTSLEVENGKFTGNLMPNPCWGEGKALAGKDLASIYSLDLQKSFFYTDSSEDLPLLEIVGKPRAVNPDKKLSAISFQNGWPIYNFTVVDRPKIFGTVRTLLAVGSMLPAAASGVASGSMQLSWQEGVNTMVSTFGDWACNFAGIETSVKGEEYLEQRPAIFLFNHQSSTDLLLAAKLIRRDTIGIAKKELERVPILGPLMKASGVIFIDRKNRDKAIEALKPAVTQLKSGKSLIVFPEGTRSKDARLGQFKKGAFHLAMASGVPIVPVVLKNAGEALPNGGKLITPTLVQVVVLPPIETTDWTKGNMDQKINDVRNLFLEELGQIEIV